LADPEPEVALEVLEPPVAAEEPGNVKIEPGVDFAKFTDKT
jgi:hypothetical protein